MVNSLLKVCTHSSLPLDRISVSISFDLGRSVHVKGTGILYIIIIKRNWIEFFFRTYRRIPGSYPWSNPPHLLLDFLISKAAIKEATVIHIVEAAMNRPGHILKLTNWNYEWTQGKKAANLLPKPHMAYPGSLVVVFKLRPSSVRNLSGLKAKGSG